MFRRALTLLAVSLVALSTASADSRARIVRLSYVEGDVQLDRLDDRGFQRAFLNMPLVEGARVWTRSDARAEIELEDGSTIRLTPDSVVTFREMRLRGDGDRSTLVELQQGTAYFDLKQRSGDDFRLLIDQQQVTPSRSSRFRVEARQGQLLLAVWRGDLDLARDNGERLTVRKNESLELDFNEVGRYYLSKGITEAAFDYWDRERDSDRARYAQQQSYRSYPAAYSYGYYDLNRYGGFFDLSGYGSLWRPYGVGIGWDPFADGSWVYYPGYGYVWVSAYPWGWTPYRYGSWLYVGGRGWCWRPGRSYTWVNVVNIYNYPPGYRVPRPPRTVVGTVVPVGTGASTSWTQAQDLGRRSPLPRHAEALDGSTGGQTTVTGGSAGSPGGSVTTGTSTLSRPTREGRSGSVVTNDVIDSRRPASLDTNNGAIIGSGVEAGVRPERGSRGESAPPAGSVSPDNQGYDRGRDRTPVSGDSVVGMDPGRDRRPSRDVNTDAPGAPGRGWSTPPQTPPPASVSVQPQPAPVSPEPAPVRPERPARTMTPPAPPAASEPRMERPARSERISPPSYDRPSPPARTAPAPAPAPPPARSAPPPPPPPSRSGSTPPSNNYVHSSGTQHGHGDRR
jgi:hypothetical protein